LGSLIKIATSIIITICFFTQMFIMVGSEEGRTEPTSSKEMVQLAVGYGENMGDLYGINGISLGDINQDGFSDFAIGAPYANPNDSPDMGQVSIFFGSDTLFGNALDPDMANIIYTGETSADLFGSAIDQCDDLSGDGKPELVVGAPGYDQDRGRTYILLSENLIQSPLNVEKIILEGANSGDRFGSSIASIGDMNGDGLPDIAVGSTGSDQVSILFRTTSGFQEMRVIGIAATQFGTSLAGLGDINGDGLNDLAIGAPATDSNKGSVAFLLGSQMISQFVMVDDLLIMNGDNAEDRFGEAISGGTDINGDRLNDTLVGVPGVGIVHVVAGSTGLSRKHLPDISEVSADEPQPIEFTSGLLTTGNTFGLGGQEDGWDWANNTYGGAEATDHIHNHYTANNVANAGQLKISLGGVPTSKGGTNDGGGSMISAAYGVGFNITDEMYRDISRGAVVRISIEYTVWSFGHETNEEYWVKARITGPSGTTYLGQNLDNGDRGDLDDEIDYRNGHDGGDHTYGPFTFKKDIDDIFTSSGMYYLDLGGKSGPWTAQGEHYEYSFDNIMLSIQPISQPEIESSIVVGEAGFGTSVDAGGDLTGDGFPDILVGAPGTIVTSSEGAIYVYPGGFLAKGTRTLDDAWKIGYGSLGSGLGETVGYIGDVNGDGKAEIIAGAPDSDSSRGLTALYSNAGSPAFTLLGPQGLTMIAGEVTVSAVISDPEDNLDPNLVWMELEASGDGTISSILSSIDMSPSSSVGHFSATFDSATLPDGDLTITLYAYDLTSLLGKLGPLNFVIDNPDAPTISIGSPINHSTLSSEVLLSVNVTDPDGDFNPNGISFMVAKQGQESSGWKKITRITSLVSSGGSLYSATWNSSEFSDDDLSLRAMVQDEKGLVSHSGILHVTIDNPDPPSVALQYPVGGEVLSGVVSIKANVTDPDAAEVGVAVEFFHSLDNGTFVSIFRGLTSPGTTFTTNWDTTTVPNGPYLIQVRVKDSTSKIATAVSPPVQVINPLTPKLTFLTPKYNETISGTYDIVAQVSNYDGPANELDLRFFSIKGTSILTFVANGTLIEGESDGSGQILFSSVIDTSKYSDDTHRLKAELRKGEMILTDAESHQFSIDNPDPPVVTWSTPGEGVTLKGVVPLVAQADDPDGDITGNGVTFSFSTDGIEWDVIGSSSEPTIERETAYYRIEWDTTKEKGGTYILLAEAQDSTGLRSEDRLESVEVKGKGEDETDIEKALGDPLFWLLLIAVIAVLMIILVTVFRKHKKEETEEAVDADMIYTRREYESMRSSREADYYPIVGGLNTGSDIEVLPPMAGGTEVEKKLALPSASPSVGTTPSAQPVPQSEGERLLPSVATGGTAATAPTAIDSPPGASPVSQPATPPVGTIPVRSEEDLEKAAKELEEIDDMLPDEGGTVAKTGAGPAGTTPGAPVAPPAPTAAPTPSSTHPQPEVRPEATKAAPGPVSPAPASAATPAAASATASPAKQPPSSAEDDDLSPEDASLFDSIDDDIAPKKDPKKEGMA